MKKLYEFTVTKEELVDESEVKQENGAEVTTTKKVKKIVPHKFFLKRPNRTVSDDGQLFYSACLADFIKRGLLTRAMLAKRYSEDNGIWTEADKKEYTNLWEQYAALQKDIESLSKKETQEFEAGKTSLSEKQKIRTEVLEKIQVFEQTQLNLFAETAENKARDKAVVWWTLNLSYDNDGKPIFGDGDFKSKFDKLEEIEEGDNQFLIQVIKKFSFFISYWYLGLALTEEDFKKLDLEYERKSPQEQA